MGTGRIKRSLGPERKMGGKKGDRTLVTERGATSEKQRRVPRGTLLGQKDRGGGASQGAEKKTAGGEKKAKRRRRGGTKAGEAAIEGTHTSNRDPAALTRSREVTSGTTQSVSDSFRNNRGGAKKTHCRGERTEADLPKPPR